MGDKEKRFVFFKYLFRVLNFIFTEVFVKSGTQCMVVEPYSLDVGTYKITFIDSKYSDWVIFDLILYTFFCIYISILGR